MMKKRKFSKIAVAFLAVIAMLTAGLGINALALVDEECDDTHTHVGCCDSEQHYMSFIEDEDDCEYAAASAQRSYIICCDNPNFRSIRLDAIHIHRWQPRPVTCVEVMTLRAETCAMCGFTMGHGWEISSGCGTTCPYI